KELADELLRLTEETISNLTYEEMNDLLFVKWVEPIMLGVHDLGIKLFQDVERKMMDLHNKYATTMVEVQSNIQESNKELVDMMNNLVGNDSDMAGIRKFQALLRGDGND